MSEASESRVRRLPARTHKLLRGKRRRLLSRSNAIREQYKRGASPVGEIEKLRASVASLRADVARQAGGSSPVAGALKQLDVSLGHLLRAERATDGQKITQEFHLGLRALSAAYRQAKRAGSDWVL
jgi:hypothetical protein